MTHINESTRYVYDASTVLFYELTHVFEQFWDFGVLGFWGFGILGFWGFGVLGFWDFGVLGFWGFGVLEVWGFGVLGFWVWGFGVLINRATLLQFERQLFFFMS